MSHSIHPPPVAARAALHSARAISTTEVLVTTGILILLTAITFPLLTSARNSRARAACSANLHSIGIAFTYYINDFHETYPAPPPTGQWEDLLRDYVHRETFHCPADSELFPSLGSSYDWRDTGNPATTLVGKYALQVNRGDTALSYDLLPGWHAQNKIQVIKVDNSIELMDQSAFFKELQQSPTR